MLRVYWVCTAIGVELELKLLTKKEKVLLKWSKNHTNKRSPILKTWPGVDLKVRSLLNRKIKF